MRGIQIQKVIFLIAIGMWCCLPQRVTAQDLRKHNWYFGNSTQGIRFNRGTNAAQLVNNQALPFNRGGSAVATDPATANLLFYSDGVRVYDACHLQMPDGTGLSGTPNANQPVAISPMPGQTNKYYVFTNSANFTAGGTISRSTVDLNQFGNAVFPSPATGIVEPVKNVPVLGLTNRSEGMIIIPHQNRVDYWIISHENGTQNFTATLIDATATFSSVIASGIGVPTTVAGFSYHAASRKIAVSPQDTNTDALILNFNDATGVISFDRNIINSGLATTTNQSIYDIEWDAKGQYLYLSRHGEPGVTADVLQYDYLNPSFTLTSVLSAPIFRSYGLQVAPDSAIYHLYQAVSGGPFLIGKITNTDTVAAAVINTQNLFTGTNFNATQFPLFTPKDSVILAVSFVASGTCQNSPTAFFPTISPNADSLRWDFGDGTTSGDWSPIYTYANAGSFNVSLTAFYRGQQQTITQPVTINPFALQLQLVQDTTACRSEFPPPRGSSTPTQFSVTLDIQGGTPTSVVWSNGDTGNTLTPDSAGYYYVVVTDASGCSAYAGVNVKEYDLEDQRTNVWYFGNKAGIDFNETPPEALNNSIMDAPEGCATVSDRNGKLIFYTDGDKVFDKTHTQIDAGIGGDPLASQSALIVAVPGDETLYYIFTTQAINGTSNYELRYSLFDLKLNSGNGALIEKNVLLFTKSTERITATPQWLIAHEYGNNTFRSYPITAQGIGEPVYSEIGSDHTFKSLQNGEGYMKIGGNNQLAVALSTPGTSNVIELFDFDNTAGTLSDYRKIDLKEPTGQVYGIEFSPGGNKLFATVKGSPSPSILFEYFLDSLQRPFFKQRIQQNGEFGALQVGPDRQIYMAINGSNTLGTVLVNEDTTQLSSLNLSGFTLLAGSNSRLGLPNFVQFQGNAFGGPGFTFAGVCLGDSTRFTGTPTDAIDNFQWFFGDGGSSTEPSPVHLYAAPGVYTVSMRLTNRCSLDTTIVQQVQIFAPPAPPSLPGAVALCTGTVTLDANIPNTPGLTHLWSGGETSQTITVTQQSFISVTNTDLNGCSSTAQTIVADNRPQVDLGADLTVCEDIGTVALNAQNPGATYQWTIDGVNSGNSQLQSVDTSTPGVFTYAVTVTDPVTTCFVTDQKEYTIKVSPSIALSKIDPAGCNTATGSLTLQINTTSPSGGPYTYSLSGPGGFLLNVFDQPAPATVVSGSKIAGTYSAIVIDQISNCQSQTSEILSNNVITGTTETVVDPCSATLRVAVTGGGPQYRFTFTNTATGQVIGPSALTVSPFVSPALPAGAYALEVRDAGNCVFGKNITVTPNPAAVVTITPDLCSTPATPTLTASANVASTFLWTTNVPGSIVSGANTSTITLLAGTNNVTYSVTATPTGIGSCPATQTVTLNVPSVITPAFTQTTACADVVTLTATPTGTFTYRWYKAGVFQPTLLGGQITLADTENGASYQVEVVNTVTGCVVRSAAQTVSVLGTIDALITSTQACEDNNPFTLTASTTATGVSYAWFFNGNAISGANTATTDQTGEGIYRVDITKGICTTSAEIIVIKAPLPVGELLDRVLICNDPDNLDPTTSSVDLDPGDFTAFDWFKNQLTLSYTARVLNADSEGTYEVDITNSFGCVSRDKTEVINECIPKISAPNAFRPTSSLSQNKDFSVFSFFITDNFQILIYNRWGELVFESSDRNFKWNGGYRNNASQPVPPGTYAYIVKYVSTFHPEQGVQEKRGGVSVLR